MKKIITAVALMSTTLFLASCGSSVDEKKPDITKPTVKTETSATGTNDMPKNPLAEPDKPVPKAEVSTLEKTPEGITDEDALALVKEKDIKFDKYVIGDKTIVVVGKEEYKKLGNRAIELITLLNGFVSGHPVKELTIDGKLRATIAEDGKTIIQLSTVATPDKKLEIKEKNIFKLLSQ